ncbi:MAG: 3-oxoacyl-[acyl-carrier protein] reductase [Candidatus Omnitrophota bacterium]|jgi:3-oxoacyl-[acyl-carrier protein] reductase
MKFKDQVVIVTGSTKGIGKAIAMSFAKQGAVTIIIGRNEALAKETCDQINASDGNADYFAGDVTNAENVQEITNKVLDKYKRIDILINNAGITKDNLLLRMSASDFDDVININLKGVFNFTKAVSKAMFRAKSGKIVNITSVIGITGNVGQANYAASKAGVIGFTKSIAKEFASRGITANTVAPGYIETDMTAEMKEQAREDTLSKIPMKKLGQVDDIANACLFLASKEANYITGQTIVVDGGMTV